MWFFPLGISTSPKLEDDEHEEDGQRLSKRPRRVQDKENLDQAGIFQVHPLQIALHVYDNEVSNLESAKLITLKFEYLVQLNIICVGIEASNDGPGNDILCNLFPDDTGLKLPHQVWMFSYVLLACLYLSVSFFYFFIFVFYLFIFLYLNDDAVSQTLCWGCHNV